jgi:hypothetical protein
MAGPSNIHPPSTGSMRATRTGPTVGASPARFASSTDGFAKRCASDCRATAAGTPIWMIAKPNHQRRRLCDWSCQTDLGYLCNRIHVTPGKTWMRVRLSTDRVLLSDFDRWDNVIRGEYVAQNEEDGYGWDEHVRRTFQIGEFDFIRGLETGWPTPLLKDIVRSSTRVFDTSKAKSIQGSFGHLTESDVVEVARPVFEQPAVRPMSPIVDLNINLEPVAGKSWRHFRTSIVRAR